MLNDERRGLLQFVPLNFLDVTVLVVDAEEILRDLRKILPAAKIALLTPKMTPPIKKICDDVRADVFIGDIETLPAIAKVFELIIAPKIFSTGEDFYAPLLTLNCLLCDSGALLTKFCEGSLTKAAVVKLLNDAVYKEIHFAQGDSEICLVKACKCTAEVAALKDLFTPEIRAELSRLLHRIEYDIDVAENFRRLIELRDREKIFDEYLSDFIGQVVVHDSAKKFLLEQLELLEIVDDD